MLDAASRGTREGLQLALNIAAMLIAFLGLIALINKGLALRRDVAPGALRLGPGPGRLPAGRPLGRLPGGRRPARDADGAQRADRLRRARRRCKATLDPRSFTIATFALCGFANFSSIGIQLGGIGALAPERRADLARLGFRALLAGTLANFLSACIAGILL